MKKPLLYLVAAALASGIVPLAPANAAPYGPCGPVGVSFNGPACSACTEAGGGQDCVGGPYEGTNPAQNICNLTGACTAPRR
jgi:hypothetical protein